MNTGRSTQEVSGQPRRVEAPAAKNPARQVMAQLGRPPGCAAPAEHPCSDVAALEVAAEELSAAADPAEPQTEERAALAAPLAQLAGLSVAGTDQHRLLGDVAVLLRDAVPAAGWASVTLGSPLEPTLLGSDSTQAQAFDGHQLQAREGPSLDAYRSAVAVSTPDATTDPRWPALARLAAGRSPIRGVLAVPIDAAGLTGVLTLYSPEPDSFGPASRRAAELMATAITGVLHNAAECESLRALAANLQRALSSRAVIDQAKGILMAGLGLDAEGAFARLVTVSNRLNVKVRVLAQLVVDGRADQLLAAAGSRPRPGSRPARD